MVQIGDFIKSGGELLTELSVLKKKIKKVRAFVFDWDGVFNDARKNGRGESYFTEVDSMGTNLMRFGNWLMNKKQMPHSAIISGEINDTAFYFIGREHFHAGYFKAKDKRIAWDDFCKKHKLKSEEIAFFYDDVLDLPLAKLAGISVCMHRTANPVFNAFVRKNKLADYITGNPCGNFALREACELVMFLQGNSEQVLKERVAYSDLYTQFIQQRNKVSSKIFEQEIKGIKPGKTL